MKLLYYLGCLLFLTSCGVSKNVLVGVKSANQKIVEQKELAKKKASDLFDDESIDKSLLSRIATKFEQLEERVANRNTVLNDLLPKMGRGKANKLVDSLQKQIIHEEAALKLLNMSLDMKSFYEFPSESVFGPGVYVVADDKQEGTKQIFKPIIDTIAVFSQKIDFDRLELMMITHGFADGQGFRQGSPLYEFLAKELNKTEPERPELNRKLSELRASNVADFAKKLIDENKTNLKEYERFVVNSLAIGRGEDLPNKKTTDYQDDDSRRRVVKFYFKILPVID